MNEGGRRDEGEMKKEGGNEEGGGVKWLPFTCDSFCMTCVAEV